MLISKKNNFIFIHIYKNAGTSITNALEKHCTNSASILTSHALQRIGITPNFGPSPYPGHITAEQLIQKIGADTFNSYFSFAVVRNPWDWQTSLYKYALKNKNHYQHELTKSFSSFQKYIEWRCSEEIRLQKDFIYSSNNKKLVSQIYRYENIQEDFKKICKRININEQLPTLNTSEKSDYKSFYNSKSKRLIEKSFHDDIELFNYQF